MDSNNHRGLTNGTDLWRAGCSETGTSGSAGGPRKRTSRKTDTAPRPDPTPTSRSPAAGPTSTGPSTSMAMPVHNRIRAAFDQLSLCL